MDNIECNIEGFNCYETTDHVLSHFTLIESKIVKDFDNLETFFNKNGIYHFELIAKIKKNGRISTVFNHSFIITKDGNDFTLFDSWEGIHSWKSRNIKFNKFINEFNKIVENKMITSHFIDFFRIEYDKKLLDSGNWLNDYPIESKFESLQLKLSKYE